jgi:multidrug transporter EmrE-like cation transporter
MMQLGQNTVIVPVAKPFWQKPSTIAIAVVGYLVFKERKKIFGKL